MICAQSSYLYMIIPNVPHEDSIRKDPLGESHNVNGVVGIISSHPNPYEAYPPIVSGYAYGNIPNIMHYCQGHVATPRYGNNYHDVLQCIHMSRSYSYLS